VISGFRHGVNEISSLLGCNTALIGNWLLTFQSSLLVPSLRVRGSKKTLEDGTDGLSQNVGNKLLVKSKGFSLSCLSKLSQ